MDLKTFKEFQRLQKNMAFWFKVDHYIKNKSPQMKSKARKIWTADAVALGLMTKAEAQTVMKELRNDTK